MTIQRILTDSEDSSGTRLAEALIRAKRVVSDLSGIISDVRLLDLDAGDPAVYWALSKPPKRFAISGASTMYQGMAASVDRDRAIMKAVGESLERYCAGLPDEDALMVATYDELRGEAVPIERFALFSERQYQEPAFPFVPMTPHLPLRWAQGHSLVRERPAYVPAAFVYVPYISRPPELQIAYSISTGVACALDRAQATYRGLLEVIERDAFMIVWQNRLTRPTIDLSTVTDPFVQRLYKALDGVPVHCQAILLTMDIPVPVILVVLSSKFDMPPLTVVGAGADLDPRRALSLALEEAYLGFCGISRNVQLFTNYLPDVSYRDVNNLHRHSLVHAVSPDIRAASGFLLNSSARISIDDLPNRSYGDINTDLRTLVDLVAAIGLDVIALELTTSDIDDVGFKVVRTVVPGLQPLDIDHSHRHLGGKRLYDVPFDLGLVRSRPGEADLNRYPHPFP